VEEVDGESLAEHAAALAEPVAALAKPVRRWPSSCGNGRARAAMAKPVRRELADPVAARELEASPWRLWLRGGPVSCPRLDPVAARELEMQALAVRRGRARGRRMASAESSVGRG
jgi:hypothetical protein